MLLLGQAFVVSLLPLLALDGAEYNEDFPFKASVLLPVP